MKSTKLDDITREDFEAFEGVRVSGVTNMWDSRTGCELSGLDKETYLGVLSNYTTLMEKFPGVRK